MPSITEEIDQVMTDLQKSVDVNGNVDLPVLLAEVISLFEHLKSALPKTNPKERSDIVDKMAQLHLFLLRESKRLSKQTGISEEQMIRFAENPDNFTRDQWLLLERVKSVMTAQTNDIKEVMKEFAPRPAEEVRTSNTKGKAKRRNRDSRKA